MYSCRICNSYEAHKFLSLGPTPLANRFLKKVGVAEFEPKFPLDLVFCEKCNLVQLDYLVPPELMFQDYIYVSSTSTTIPVHFAAYADEIASRFVSSPDDLVVEIGSNDGCLLRGFQRHRVRTLGVEPATNIASIATASGIETINKFFNQATAMEIREKCGIAKVVIGNNVLAHIGDLRGIVKSLETLLADDGVAVFEVPYLLDLLSNHEFDTVYHEHVSYFSLHPLKVLFAYGNLRIFDVKRFSVHGGTMRVYVTRADASHAEAPSVSEMLLLEKRERLDSLVTYKKFSERVLALRESLTLLLRELKSQGARIAGYGAPAKGNTLLNYMGIGPDTIEFIVDKNPLKHGMYTPGTHIPVLPLTELKGRRPDYVLLLAWNFSDEIVEQQREYLWTGGKFILPIPAPKVLTNEALKDLDPGTFSVQGIAR